MKAALVALLLAAAPAAAEVRVHVAEGRVDVQATAAPLSEVLDRLARQTGMKVVYEGPVPRPLVSLSLERRTQAEAVLGILEGLGLNYVLQFDATGTRVQTLMMTGAASTTASAARSSAPAATYRTTPPISSPDQVDDEPLDEEEEVEQPPVQGPPPVVPPPGPVQVPAPVASPPAVNPAPAFPGLSGPGYSYPLAPNPLTPYPAQAGRNVPASPAPQASPSPPSEPR